MKLVASLEKLFERILSFLMTLACIILSFVTLSVCLEVILRYFFNRPQVWVIELSEYGLLYVTFLGAAWVLKEGGHVRVDLVTNLLNPKNQVLCSLISFVICLAVSTVLTVYGIRVTWEHFAKGLYNPTILEIPKAAILVVIPLGGTTLLIQSMRNLLQSLRGAMERSARR